jgi:hypothetical protein
LGTALSDTSSTQTSRSKRVFFWILLLALLAAPVVLAEVYLRSIGIGNPILFQAESGYRYAPKPNQKQVGPNGAAITLDSKGLRGVKDWAAPADDKILFMGASATWGGSYVDNKDLFSNVVCLRLEQLISRNFTCGNAGVNAYGVDNMAARIRYRDFADEAAIVVTLGSFNAVRGLTELDSLPYFTQPPPGPFKALWEGATFGAWRLLQILRVMNYDRTYDLRVAERSLDNLFAALRETDRPGRKVLIVLLPMREHLNGKENDLTKHVRAVLQGSTYDFLDLHQPISTIPNPDTFYHADGSHLALAGHQFVGGLIAEKLQGFFAKQP